MHTHSRIPCATTANALPSQIIVYELHDRYTTSDHQPSYRTRKDLRYRARSVQPSDVDATHARALDSPTKLEMGFRLSHT